ncbi:MAG: DNA-processing protein DprA [Zavarzinella sp.]
MGPKLTENLLAHFGTAADIFNASEAELCQVPLVGTKVAKAIRSDTTLKKVEDELALVAKHGIAVVGWHDAGFPSPLRVIPDPTRILYHRGQLLETDSKAIAIVGSRNCTGYGVRMATRLASGLVRAGFTVVSGLALGIDGAAHRGALEANGRTLAVLAGGLSSIYPPEHKDLAEKVAQSGALVSETPMAIAPQRGMFHARNRIISGLSLATVVVECNARSGALITARHALEQNKDVFVIPGNVDIPQNEGSLQLIRDGARLIRGIDDLLEDLQGLKASLPEHSPSPTQQELFSENPTPVCTAPPEMSAEHRTIWDTLTEPKHVDLLSRELSLSAGDLTRLLFSMEMLRLVRRRPGNFYERT